MNLTLKIKRLKLRFKVWRYKRNGFFEWMPLYKIPMRKRELKRLSKIGLVEKRSCSKPVMYRFKLEVYKRQFGLC